MKDRFGREHVYLRLAVTDRCNLRCTYCMPALPTFLDRARVLTDEELLRLAAIFARLGIRKIRLTGGEPTVRRGLVELCSRLGALPGVETVALTTNGTSLRKLARPLYDAGVRRLNVSLDSVDKDRFARITGRDALGAVLAGIDEALCVGFVPLKLNAVVLGGMNEDEVLEIAELARSRPIEVRFIEFMPFQANGWSRTRFVPCTSVRTSLAAAHTLVPEPRTDRTGGVAQDFRIPGFMGRICFVTPFSESFCQRCNRLRLTADGQLKTCLYSAPEADLGSALRAGASDEQLEELILAAVTLKPRGHPSLEKVASTTLTRMHAVGG